MQRHTRTVHAKDKKKAVRPSPQLSARCTPISSPSESSPPQPQRSCTPPQAAPSPAVTTMKVAPSPCSEVSESLPSSPVTVDGSVLYRFNDQTTVSLLTLSQKFNRVQDIELNSKVSSLFLVWGTLSNLTLPVIQSSQMIALNEESSLLYALLACGAADSNQFEDCLKLLNKSWLLVLKAGDDPSAIIQSLTLISYIYLNNYYVLKKKSMLSQFDLVPIEIVLEYLDTTTTRVLEFNAPPLFNYWHIFIILANFTLSYNKPPAKVHQQFLTKTLPGENCTLLEAFDTLTRLPCVPTGDGITADCVLMGLSNELQASRFNDRFSFESKPFLHNAIIMANRAFTQINGETGDETSILNNLITVSKRNLLMNCPLRFQDLISEYVVVPKSRHHWNLLRVTLKEFTYQYNTSNLQQFLQAGTEEDVATCCLEYMSSLKISSVNNNLGLISHPLLFIGFISNANLHSDFDSLLNLPTNYTWSVVETHLCLLKIFTNLNSHVEFMTNPIIQSIVYLIYEMGSSSTRDVQNEVAKMLESSVTRVSPQFIEFITRNLHQCLRSWISYSYTGLSKHQILDGIDQMIGHLSPEQSPIQSGRNSPGGNRYIYPSPTTAPLIPSLQPPMTQQPATAANVGYSSQPRITLPPINIASASSQKGISLPLPFMHEQSYRYRSF